MQNLTPEGLRIVTDAAKRHGVSLDGALACLMRSREGMGARLNSITPISAGWDNGRRAE